MVTTLPNPVAAAQWLRSRVPAAPLGGRLGAGSGAPGTPGRDGLRARGMLHADSRALQAGDAFIAWPGHATDARRYVRAALQAGAAACLVEHEGLVAFDLPDDPRVASLAGLKAAAGEIAAIFHGRPGAQLDVVAVTGTNGKSSTAWWMAQALTSLGRRCGLVGTLGIGEPPRVGAAAALSDAAAAGTGAAERGSIRATGLTTPDPVTLQAALRDMVDSGFVACAIEASSIGIAEHRLAGLPVSVAQFTNFSRDHLDYHGDMAAYWACKRALFDAPGLRAAVINIDDPQGAALAAELAAELVAEQAVDPAVNPAVRPLDLWTVSTHGAQRSRARLAAQNIRYVDGGLAFDVIEGGRVLPVRSALIGDYNASNLLVVLAGLRALGVALTQAVQVVPRLMPVPGRMQAVTELAIQPRSVVAGIGALPTAIADARALPEAIAYTRALPMVVVDYAHTPDALDKALAALRPLAEARGGRLCCVFGCGGDRDASKRPLMGAIAQRLADEVVLTDDNPRGESPQAILAQIVAGMAAAPAPQVIGDRRQAIEFAVSRAAVADVVLIAGKGHETTQEVAGVKQPFSDLEVASRSLRARSTQC